MKEKEKNNETVENALKNLAGSSERCGSSKPYTAFTGGDA